MLLIVIVNVVAATYVLSPGAGTPVGAAGLEGPNPVPQSMITSPGFAAMVVAPANVLAFTTSE
jgi:hypothetical protein